MDLNGLKMVIQNKKLIGYIAAVFSTILLASEGIFVRNVATSATVMTFARLGIGLIFLVLYLMITGEIKQIKGVKLSFPLLSTGVLLSSTSLCYISALQLTSLANAVFLLYLGPLFAVGIAAFLLKERFTLINAGMLALAFLGLLFLLEFDFSFDTIGAQALLWGGASAVCYAFYIVLNRNISHDISASTRSFYQLAVGTLVLIPFLDSSALNITTGEIFWLIALGFAHGFLAFTMIIFALKHLKAVEYGTISYIEPLAASLVGFALYSEALSTLQLAGCAIIFAGGIIQVIMAQNL